jgi:hypothetical protein
LLARIFKLTVNKMNDWFNFIPDSYQGFIRDSLTINCDTLIHFDQMGASESAGPQTVLSEQAFDKPAGAGLTVGSGYVNYAIRLLRITKQFS